MASKSDIFIQNTLGEGFMEALEKVELWKPGTRTTIDHEEIKTALQIVPRIVISLLIRELSPMQLGENKAVPLFFGSGALMRVTKHERDVYSGEIEQDGKIIVDFKMRSMPGVGLVIMSAFELYDMDNELNSEIEPAAQQAMPNPHPVALEQVQRMIDERLAMRDLVEKVIENKLQHRDAVQALILAKLTEDLQSKKAKDQIVELAKISEVTTPEPIEYHRGITNGLKMAESIVTGQEPEFLEPTENKAKKMPLKDFLESRKSKLKKNEFNVKLLKTDTVDCPDCGQNIFKNEVISGCICLGDDREGKIFLKKSEDGIKIRFSKQWDPENIELLLEALRRKHG